MATEAGLKVHLGSLEEVDLPEESYDLVFMIQTIEHAENPGSVLNSIFKLLKKGGRLVIVTDNTGSIDIKLFKRKYWAGYHFPRHWNLFNRHSLVKLGSKSGFEVDNFTTIVSPVNWIYSIHNSLVDKHKPKWLINQLTLKSLISLFVFTALDLYCKNLVKEHYYKLLLENLYKKIDE